MKTLTIRDPWAQAIAQGVKRIETRSWRASYRGPLAIHAAKRLDRHDVLSSRHVPGDWPRGAVIAVCDLVDCARIVVYHLELPYEAGQPFVLDTHHRVTVGTEPLTDEVELDWGHYATGRWAWKLENVRRIEPVYVKGMLGLWEWTP